MLLFDLILLTLRRLKSRPILTLLALVGVILAIAILSSTAFFSQAVDRVLLQEELNVLSRSTGRHPFATRIYLFPTTRIPVSLSNAETYGVNVAGAFSGEIGLPVKRQGLLVESPGMMLLPDENDTRYVGSPNKLLSQVTTVYIKDVSNYIKTVAGDAFESATPSNGDVLDLWMHTRLAQEMGVQAGETFRLTVNLSQLPRQVRIRGLWQANDNLDPFWFKNPEQTLKSALLIQRDDYARFIEPLFKAKTGAISWPITLDDGALNPAHAKQYAQGFARGMTVINQFLPGAKLDVSALDSLEKFVLRQSTLTLTLLSFNIPAFGFLLAFLILIALTQADWQRRETAILVSRGMNLSSVVSLTVLEEFLLYLVGVPLGLLAGMLLAQAMGNTLSFLSFTRRDPLPVSLQGVDPWLVLAGIAATLIARLTPTIQTARQSVVLLKRERARPLRPPWWQRIWLDLILLLPTYYAYQQMVQRGSLTELTDGKPEGLFQDPLLILLPALIVLCAGLLTMRLFTVVMRLLDWIGSRTSMVTLYLTLRQLSRHGQHAVNSLLLVIISLALGIYTYSLAASLDQWLIDRIYYSVGTDASFLPMPPESGATEPGPASNDSEVDMTWLPTSTDFAQIKGVVAVSRVGRYPAQIAGTGDEKIKGHFLAVDRADFASIAWFRNDFADQSLGAMMNQLALDDMHIIVPQAYLAEAHLRIGDLVPIQLSADDIVISGDFKIAGSYRHFPTVYEDDFTVVGNLDALSMLAGLDFPYSVWMRTKNNSQLTVNKPPLNSESIDLFSALKDKGVLPGQPRDARTQVKIEQGKFERVGIFGTLSVGFMAASAMAALALLIYSYASLQERLYQFGVLRAIGVGHRQVVVQVICEYILLIAFGALAGYWIGSATAQLFAPFFRITSDRNHLLPPLLPIIPQDKISALVLIFALCMVAVEAAVIMRALSGRIFDALRIGHQG